MIISGHFQRMQRSREDLFSGCRGLETPSRGRLAQRQNEQNVLSLKRQHGASPTQVAVSFTEAEVVAAPHMQRGQTLCKEPTSVAERAAQEGPRVQRGHF